MLQQPMLRVQGNVPDIQCFQSFNCCATLDNSVLLVPRQRLAWFAAWVVKKNRITQLAQMASPKMPLTVTETDTLKNFNVLYVNCKGFRQMLIQKALGMVMARCLT